MTSISACAVGSLSARVRLPARAITVPEGPTSTAPTGTSPRRRPLGLRQRHVHVAEPRRRCHNQSRLCTANGPMPKSTRSGPAARARAAQPLLRPPQSRAPRRAPLPARDETMRIAKAMARAGLCSRRDRALIAEAASASAARCWRARRDVGPGDRVLIDGRPLPAAALPQLWRYYAARPRHHAPRSPGPPDRVREAAAGCRASSPSAASTSTARACCC